MAKVKKAYFCKNCGFEAPKWLGRCPSCGEWNTFTEEIVARESGSVPANVAGSLPAAKPQRVRDIRESEHRRMDLGNSEVNRVLGGGMVPGSLILLGGEPGIGKSTLSLQLALAANGLKTLYVSGEESLKQIKIRAARLHISSPELYILAETDMEQIINETELLEPDILIVDSIQTVYKRDLTAAPGGTTQIKECAMSLMQYAKNRNVTIFIVGHVNKEGTLAGPKILEHMVDCVLYFEGDQHMTYRILRAAKNRFGATNEIGVFEMLDAGLREVENPSEMLLSGRPADASGTCVTCVMEGARPVLAEVQALLAPCAGARPMRSSNGFDYNRASMLLAVLEKRGSLKVSQCDAYLNIIGGLTLDEPAAGLAAVVAIASSYLDKPVPSTMAAIGEVGLSGEIRSITHMEQRLSEVKRLGFTQCMVPAHKVKDLKAPVGLELLPVANISRALQLLARGQ